MYYLYYIILAVVSYFIGNISSARIISKVLKGDVTKSGSGNPGTLNVWRTFGFWPGIITFVLDALKGIVPTLVAYFLFGHIGCNPEIALYVAGFFVVLGHVFPVVFKFKGGKGIATTIGVFLVANWRVSLILFVIMIVGMLFIKYASIFTIGFVVCMSIVELCYVYPPYWINYILICGILFLVIYAHRSNINNLIHGRENKTELWAMVKRLFSHKEKSKVSTIDAQKPAQSEDLEPKDTSSSDEDKNNQ